MAIMSYFPSYQDVIMMIMSGFPSYQDVIIMIMACFISYQEILIVILLWQCPVSHVSHVSHDNVMFVMFLMIMSYFPSYEDGMIVKLSYLKCLSCAGEQDSDGEQHSQDQMFPQSNPAAFPVSSIVFSLCLITMIIGTSTYQYKTEQHSISTYKYKRE